jgi:hypothetical protein
LAGRADFIITLLEVAVVYWTTVLTTRVSADEAGASNITPTLFIVGSFVALRARSHLPAALAAQWLCAVGTFGKIHARSTPLIGAQFAEIRLDDALFEDAVFADLHGRAGFPSLASKETSLLEQRVLEHSKSAGEALKAALRAKDRAVFVVIFIVGWNDALRANTLSAFLALNRVFHAGRASPLTRRAEGEDLSQARARLVRGLEADFQNRIAEDWIAWCCRE